MKTYQERIEELEAAGLTNGEAQAVIEAEDMVADKAESESRYTPGPWTISENIGKKSELGIIADSAPCIIAVMHGAKGGEWPEIAQANARLISCAPEMLSALRRLLDCPDLSFENMEAESVNAIAEARAVIAKAEGRAE